MQFDHGQPVASASSLPLLLFLFCLAATFLFLQARERPHALLVDLPIAALVPGPPRDLAVHRVGVDLAGFPTIEGRSLSHAAFDNWLAVQATSPRKPGIIFDPDAESRYGDALLVIHALWRQGFTLGPFCFGRLAEHRYFDTDRRTRPLRLTLAPAPTPAPVPPQREADAACDPRSYWLPDV